MAHYFHVHYPKVTPQGVVFLCILLFAYSQSSPATTPQRQLLHEVIVESVIDADTLRVHDGVGLKTIRLLGVDALEVTRSNHARRQAKTLGVDSEDIVQIAKATATEVRRLLPVGAAVWVELPPLELDKYGRTLAYVHLPESAVVLNDELLRRGLALPYGDHSSLEHHRRASAAVQEAKVARRGLWKFFRLSQIDPERLYP